MKASKNPKSNQILKAMQFLSYKHLFRLNIVTFRNAVKVGGNGKVKMKYSVVLHI